MSSFVMLNEGFNDLFNELAVRAEHSNNVCDVHYSISRDVRSFLGIETFGNPSEALVNAKAADRVLALFKSNVEAVYQRYEHMSEEDRGYNPEPKLTRSTYWPKWSHIQLFKHLQCLHYQMSEGEIPNTATYTNLETLINAIAVSLATHTPEYDKAAWDFKESVRPIDDTNYSAIRGEHYV